VSGAVYKDEGLNLGGVYVTLERSQRDGRIIVEIDTAGAEGGDVWDDEAMVPRLRVVINSDVGNLGPDGSFDWSSDA
jgi:hypothetical protein